MYGKEPMDETITFRVSEDEIAAYNRAWQQLGFKSRSQFHRDASNVMATGGGQKRHTVNPAILLEINTHLNRVGSALAELITLAENDNLPDGQKFSESLNKAISDIHVVRRKVS